MTSTYSGSSLRERDQIIHEKYQKEIRDLEIKIQKVKYTADETSKNLFDAQNRGRRLAESLGFQDTYDAQVAIDSSDSSLTYRECLNRLRETEAELTVEKKEVRLLQIRLRNMERENKRLTLEKRELEERYDDLRDKKYRATEEFKKNYKKWHLLNLWLFGDKNMSEKLGKTAEELFGFKLPHKQKKAFELSGGPDLPDSDDYYPVSLLTSPRKPGTTPSPGVPAHNKENEGTRVLESKGARARSANSAASSRRSLSPTKATPRAPRRNSLLTSVTNVAVPSASPTVFLTNSTPSATKALSAATTSTTRVPLSFTPIINTTAVSEKSSYITSPLNNKLSGTLLTSSPSIPRKLNYSSDTEDDSQAILLPSTNPRTGQPVFFKVPAPPPKAGPSHLANAALKTPQSNPPSRSLLFQSEPGPRRILPLDESTRAKEPIQFSDRDRESGRPVKMRRISENNYDTSAISSVANASSSSASEPRPRTTDTFSTRKDKEPENTNDTSTPLAAKNTGQKRPGDYSAFKGRGRYGKVAQEQNESTINTLFTIDPAQNGGVAYQYDEVVRNRQARRKMDGGDCECCREYYENVGPLPNRLQAPLWRSPTSSPSKPCPRHASAEHDRVDNRSSPSSSRAARRSDIESHKKAISRHRHTWARATTPPGYWEIGFPNTQEVGNINAKAREMHKRKKEEVEREAERAGGRYRRK